MISRRAFLTQQSGGEFGLVLHLRSLTSEVNGCLSQAVILGCGDEQTLQQTYFRLLGSASCVQNFDDSLRFAIRITYRISLRSSSLWEPRHPLLKVFIRYFIFSFTLTSSASEYNEFTIRMLVYHHTSRKWIK